jgi:hypothetical protein
MSNSPDRGETPRTHDGSDEDHAPYAASGSVPPPADDTYNGWSNRETWACHLWLSNEESLYHWAEETVCLEGADGLREGLEQLQAAIVDTSDSYAYAEGTGLVLYARDARLALGDIGSLWRVDWEEVAAAFRES